MMSLNQRLEYASFLHDSQGGVLLSFKDLGLELVIERTDLEAAYVLHNKRLLLMWSAR